MKTKVILLVMALLFGAVGLVSAKDTPAKKADHSCYCVDCAKCCVNGCIDNCKDCSKCCPGGVCADKTSAKATSAKACKKSCCETSKKASAVKAAPSTSSTTVKQ